MASNRHGSLLKSATAVVRLPRRCVAGRWAWCKLSMQQSSKRYLKPSPDEVITEEKRRVRAFWRAPHRASATRAQTKRERFTSDGEAVLILRKAAAKVRILDGDHSESPIVLTHFEGR